MAKGQWLKNIFLSNRAVGAIVAVIGAAMTAFPPTTTAGLIVLPWGLAQLGVGLVNKGKKMDEEKKVEAGAIADQVESKIN